MYNKSLQHSVKDIYKYENHLHTFELSNPQPAIVVATERSQLSHIEKCMNTLAFEGDSAGFFQWQQLHVYRNEKSPVLCKTRPAPYCPLVRNGEIVTIDCY